MAKKNYDALERVIVLYNMDTSWPKADQRNALRLVDNMLDGLEGMGLRLAAVEIQEDLEPLSNYDPDEWVIFNWCEGFAGQPWSDALVAKGLEQNGFVYTGADSRTLRKSQNKYTVKKALMSAGAPTPPGQAMHHRQVKEWMYYPAMVKPANQHCSFGISRASVVESSAELARQILRIEKEFDSPALVEPFIDGREFHVGVWGNRKVEVLPPVELDYSRYPDMHDRIYTYDSKFNPDSDGWTGIKWLCPAEVDDKLFGILEDAAIAAYRAMRCRDYARMDIRLWNGAPMVLDVNPNPDLDPESVIPMAAEAIGFDYGRMVYHILELASARLRLRRTRRVRKTVSQLA